jgi:hypothetical protein
MLLGAAIVIPFTVNSLQFFLIAGFVRHIDTQEFLAGQLTIRTPCIAVAP